MTNHLLINNKVYETETPEWVYTNEDWSFDGSFKAFIGQEVSEDIYYHMLNVLPPLSLNGGALAKRLGIIEGFRVGEPYSSADSKKTGQHTFFYAAFGKSKSGKYFFLGNQNKYGEICEESTHEVIEND